eukprot:1547166-Alexandrium_andersonii.AAC.1
MEGRPLYTLTPSRRHLQTSVGCCGRPGGHARADRWNARAERGLHQSSMCSMCASDRPSSSASRPFRPG